MYSVQILYTICANFTIRIGGREMAIEWEHNEHGHTLRLFKHLAICVFRKHNNWMFTCFDLGFLNTRLLATGLDEAKEEAARLVLEKIRELTRELPSAEEKLEMLCNL